MQTLPDDWQIDPSSQPERFGHRLPIPWQSLGGSHASGADVMTGPPLVVALVVDELDPPAVPPVPFVLEFASVVVLPLPESLSSLPLQPQPSAKPKARVAAAATALVVEPNLLAIILARQ